MNLSALLRASRTSAWKRFLLNQGLNFKIPFNNPHGFRVIPLPEGGIRVRIPWWHVNRNHIKGMHACALATGAELCSGLSVLEHLDPAQYRLIMASLHMEYHKQAKSTAFAQCAPTIADVQAHVMTPLAVAESVRYNSTVEVHDVEGTHIATGTIIWQVKKWGSVRTKV
ncbi:MAG: DUF4442 domain-containing protein [Flavobacteriales bacterium]|nr:DUF4442 domain-containing protein [Flavobacteriales bacterium]